jgi:hypothetical protein
MVLNSTLEYINIQLSGTVYTNELQFYSSYNVITSTSITPTKNHGTTDNVNPVNLVPAPNASEQHQLRHCSIFNTDTRHQTVTVTYSGGSGVAVIYSVALDPDEQIQYTPENGWLVYNTSGQLKILGSYEGPQSLRFPPTLKPINATTSLTVTSGTDFAEYLGRADRSYSSIKLRFNNTQAPTSVTWAEIAIYKSLISLASATTVMQYCGFKDVTSDITTTGNKTITIPVTGITANDDLFVVFGIVEAGTDWTVRAGIVDTLVSGAMGSVTGSLRPSTNSTLTITNSATPSMPWVAWQPSQW